MCVRLSKPSFSFPQPREGTRRALVKERELGWQAETHEESGSGTQVGSGKIEQLGLGALTLLGKEPSISRR